MCDHEQKSKVGFHFYNLLQSSTSLCLLSSHSPLCLIPSPLSLFSSSSGPLSDLFCNPPHCQQLSLPPLSYSPYPLPCTQNLLPSLFLNSVDLKHPGTLL